MVKPYRVIGEHVHTITASDIGKSLPAIGRVQPIDVGKRIYVSDGIHSVENQSQLEARLNKRSTHRIE